MTKAGLELFHAQVTSLLAPLVSSQPVPQRSQVLLSLRPRDDDYALIFSESAVDRARSGYAKLWQLVPAIPLKPTHTQLRAAVAWSEDFQTCHARSESFPGGYREIASQILPGLPWAVWELIETGERDGLLFDGLVGLGERIVWCPKPWRVLQ